MERLITCNICEQTMPVERFYVKKIFPGTKRERCKSCSVKHARDWNLVHPERVKETVDRYRASDEAKAVNKEWRDHHKEHLKAEVYKWRAENPDQEKAIVKKSRKKHHLKVLTRNREREIAEITAIPAWADRQKISDIYLKAKQITKETGILHHVDHIIPLRGKYVCGLHIETNLQIIPAIVNLRKGNKVNIGVYT